MRHFSRFSRDSFNVDLSNVDWNALLNKKTCDADNLFSSFYNKFKKLISKHAPMKHLWKEFQTLKQNNSLLDGINGRSIQTLLRE